MKKLNIRLIVLVGILSICATYGVLADVRADESSDGSIAHSMTVSPPNSRIILTPGETYTNALRISNSSNSTKDLIYSASLAPFSETTNDDGSTTSDHVSVSNYNQMMDWITLDHDSGTIAPGETDFLTYTINVPDNAPAGGQYAMILVRDDTDNAGDDDGNVNIVNIMQFGSIIYARVAGEAIESGTILENRVPLISFSSPLVTSSTVKNNGNVHADAEYTLEVWPLFSDEEIYTNVEDPKLSLILPESEKYNTQEWIEAPAIGIFRVRQTIRFLGNESIVERTVILCPLWLILVIVFVIVMLIVWSITRRRSRRSFDDRDDDE